MRVASSPPHDASLRQRLNARWESDPAAVFQSLESVDPTAAARIGAADRQRIVRARELFELTGVPISEHWARHRERPKYRHLMAAQQLPRELLYARIARRVERMFSSGLEEEVDRILGSGVPRGAHAMKAIGYRQVVGMLEGRWDRSTAIESFTLAIAFLDECEP